MSQCARTVLLVRPAAFGANPETAASNVFQAASGRQEARFLALEEFDRAVRTLRDADARVVVLEDGAPPERPDAVFPNNWFSTHDDGTLVLYPMLSRARRWERRPEDIAELFEIQRTVDLSPWEDRGKHLEGTGSMVLDRLGKTAYASLSPRTDPEVLLAFCSEVGYQPLTFTARFNGAPVYHTNVMMSLGEGFAAVALECLDDAAERAAVRSALERSGREIIELAPRQIAWFSSNILQISLSSGRRAIVASETGLNHLRADQIRLLEGHGELISLQLETIEKYGGGSARCMLAEIFLTPRDRAGS